MVLVSQSSSSSVKSLIRVDLATVPTSTCTYTQTITVKVSQSLRNEFDDANHTLEYDDDTTIIPRSTTVIARRQPALKQGAGRAARYVSGKAPVSAKNAGRKEQAAKASSSKPSSSAISLMNNAMTEEERMAAMFNAQTEQWSAQQEEMSQ